MAATVLTVSELNSRAKKILAASGEMSNLFVRGELSNVKPPSARGHLYFTLKDASSAVRVVMFESYAAGLRFRPVDGLSVICAGRADIYERGGDFQLYATAMVPEGVGAAALAARQVKEKLEAEGLFRRELKRPVKKFPRAVAVVTSDRGAAVHDIINVLGRRNPAAKILLCPVTVQGEGAAADIVAMLERVYRRRDVDTIIVGRGGGSAEDLDCFNDEALARAVRRSPVPVISAVGHETDYTICDLAADLRAPTPSAAAELVSADLGEVKAALGGLRDALGSCADGLLKEDSSALYLLTLRLRRRGGELLAGQEKGIATLRARLDGGARSALRERGAGLAAAAGKLSALNPLSTLSRGYAVLYKAGGAVKSVSALSPGDGVTVRLSDGTAAATINEVSAAG